MARVRFPFKDPGDEYVCRSVSKEFTEQLTKLECRNNMCDCNGTFSPSNLPGIAYCGHHACNNTVTLLGEFATPQRPFIANFDCKEKQQHIRENHRKLDNYLRDKLLEDFFTVIAQGGVKCSNIPCGQVHPRHNAVISIAPIGPTVKPAEKPTFVCVWCATTAEKYATYEMRLIPENVYNANKSPGRLAQSVNRDQKDVGWAMYMCCIHGDDGFNNYRATTLPCGHLCCYTCAQYHKGDIKCKICNTTFGTAQFSVEIYTKYLGYPKMEEMLPCQGGCMQKHPHSNIVFIKDLPPIINEFFDSYKGEKDHWCVWCVVEKMINDRLDRLKGAK